MNGRCDNDPLDPTDDVCDLCGGEFCSGCLVAASKRNRTIACKSCTMVNAAVRPGKITRVRSRRDAKKRRQELRAERSTMHEEGRFVFFDEASDDALSVLGSEATGPAQPVDADRTGSLDSCATDGGSGRDDSATMPAEESDNDWLALLDLEVKKEADETLYSPDENYAVPMAPAMERLEQLRATTDTDVEGVPASLQPRAMAARGDQRPEGDMGGSFDDIDPFASTSTPSAAATSNPGAPTPVPAAFQTPDTQPAADPEPAPVPAAFQTPDTQPATDPEPAPVPAAFQTPDTQPATDPEPAPVPAAFQTPDTQPAADPQPAPVPAAFQTPDTQPATDRRIAAIPDVFLSLSTQATPPQHRRADDPPATPVEPAVTEIDQDGAWIPPALRGA